MAMLQWLSTSAAFVTFADSDRRDCSLDFLPHYSNLDLDRIRMKKPTFRHPESQLAQNSSS
jgi:hypothetical protein